MTETQEQPDRAGGRERPTSRRSTCPWPTLRPALEAVLMVADQPLDHLTLAAAVGHPGRGGRRRSPAWRAEYDEQGRGFELRNVAGGWRYYTREELAAVVERFVLDGQQARLTQAALETLAVVAYKQPVSRARVSAIRGVNVDGVMRTLLTRGLVEEAGHGPRDRRDLYRTTELLPRADRRHLARRAARARAVPARPRRPRRPDQPEVVADGCRSRLPPSRPGMIGRDPQTDDDGLVRLQKLLAQSGVASRRKCEELMLAGLVEVDGEVVTRLGTKVDPRTAVIRVDGQAAAAGQRARLPGAEQAARRRLDDVRPAGPAHPRRPRRRPARAALPRRAARHRHRRADPAHQRRRLRPTGRAPVVRAGQDLRRRGRRRRRPGDAAAAARRRHPRGRPGRRCTRCRGRLDARRTARSSSW